MNIVEERYIGNTLIRIATDCIKSPAEVEAILKRIGVIVSKDRQKGG